MAADRQSVAGNGESPSPISGSAGHALLAVGGLLRRAEVSPDGRALYKSGGGEADTFYRDRWCPSREAESALPTGLGPGPRYRDPGQQERNRDRPDGCDDPVDVD